MKLLYKALNLRTGKTVTGSYVRSSRLYVVLHIPYAGQVRFRKSDGLSVGIHENHYKLEGEKS